MGIVTPAEFDALTRLDFQIFAERVFAHLNPGIPYLDNFHISKMTTKLEAARQGKIKRLIMNVPPRSLKSLIASVAFTAWISVMIRPRRSLRQAMLKIWPMTYRAIAVRSCRVNGINACSQPPASTLLDSPRMPLRRRLGASGGRRRWAEA